MTSKARLLTVLRGGIPDRVPVSPFVQDEYLSYYYPERKQVDRVFDAVELARELGFDLIAKPRSFEHPHFLRKSFPNWELHEEREVRDGKVYVKRSIETPNRTLTQVQAGPDAGAASAGVHLSTQEYFLKEREDIEAFIEHMPAIDAATIDEMSTVTATWIKALGEDGIAAPWGWCGVYNMVSEYRSIESLVMDVHDDPSMTTRACITPCWTSWPRKWRSTTRTSRKPSWTASASRATWPTAGCSVRPGLPIMSSPTNSR